ncbi:hypothetical protein BH24DEI2_BH24DEI2_01630 [soil metagenome]
MKRIGIREAKNTFSDVLAQAKKAPIVVTNHGKPDSVVMSFEQYRQLAERKTGLDLFDGIDWSDGELEVHPTFEQRTVTFD